MPPLLEVVREWNLHFRVKKSRTYNEDDNLRGYVITLQNFEKLLKEGQKKGLVTITEKTIEIKDENF